MPLPSRATRLVAGSLLLVTGCTEPTVVSDCVPGVDPDCDMPMPADEVVAGVNLTALFAPPTMAEVEAARATTPATDAEATVTALPAGRDGVQRFRLALDREGRRIVTAFVRVPGTLAETTRLPVAVVLTDGTDGATDADALTDASFGALVDGFVQIVVAYRGESLAVDGEAARSDLAPDPYRADVADVRAVLAALPRVPRADRQRVAILGVGRGGTVALLTALQDPAAVDAVVTLGAPTDLFAPSFRDEARTRLLEESPTAPYPALDVLAAPVLAVRDGELAPGAARVALAALSPARLAAGRTLPAVLALHAAGDLVVGEDQLASLRAALTSEAGTSRVADVVEGADHDGLIRVPTVQSRIVAFLGTAL
ncbi:alpha/beta hydrolase family protein [Rubrivirga sp.]|uniref:alpha/beta hydrolase family protein n=1 Tax=Rubrivirga sp. TaxID=1885344 RepID=UPI003B52C05F